METSGRASGYDLFKLIVAIILLILFFLLLRRAAPTPTAVSTTETTLPISSKTPDANPIAVLATSTESSPTSTPVPLPSLTPTLEPAPASTATNAVDSTVTPLPSPTATSVLEATPTLISETPSTTTACEAAAARSRLQSGTNATILRRLNFRSSPGIQDNWLRTNIPGTQVEVVGGPECVPHAVGAYVWWQIRLPDGAVGWSAEGSIHGTFYFMEPTE